MTTATWLVSPDGSYYTPLSPLIYSLPLEVMSEREMSRNGLILPRSSWPSSHSSCCLPSCHAHTKLHRALSHTTKNAICTIHAPRTSSSQHFRRSNCRSWAVHVWFGSWANVTLPSHTRFHGAPPHGTTIRSLWTEPDPGTMGGGYLCAGRIRTPPISGIPRYM